LPKILRLFSNSKNVVGWPRTSLGNLKLSKSEKEILTSHLESIMYVRASSWAAAPNSSEPSIAMKGWSPVLVSSAWSPTNVIKDKSESNFGVGTGAKGPKDCAVPLA